MAECRCDFETRSDVDLKQRGAGPYFASPHWRALILCYSIDDGPIRDWTGGPCPDDLKRHIESGGFIKAFNASFERHCFDEMARRHGWPRPAFDRYRCSMATASALGLPRSLDKLGEALGLAVKKDKRGAALIRFFSIPAKHEPLTFREPQDHPKEFAEFVAYCRQDVATEAEADRRMVSLSDDEQAVYTLSETINQRGVRIDTASARAAIRLIEKEKARLDAEMAEATGGVVTACSQAARLTAWLAAQGLLLDGVAKDDILEAFELDDLPERARRALLLRQEASKSSTAKLTAFLRRADADDRVRGCYVYHGAAPGRWSSAGGVNFANLPRPRAAFDDAELDAATLFAAFRTEEPALLRTLYGDELGKPTHLVSDALRGFLIAAPGRDFVAVDYSGIQGAIGAWLSDEKWKLQAMREIIADPTLPDLYRRAAAGILGTTTEVITKKHHMRQAVGKTSELACFGQNTYILTNSGPKRIVDVQTTDMLWDGEEWIAHQGVISKGVRPVVTVDGIKITEDHLILVSDMWVKADQVNSEQDMLDRALATGSENLPSLVSTMENSMAYEPFLSNAHAEDQSIPWRWPLCEKERRQDAYLVEQTKMQKQRSSISVTQTLFLTTSTDDDSSIAYQLASPDACNQKMQAIQTTEVAELKYFGAETDVNFSDTLSQWTDGTIQNSNSTASMSTATMRRETFALSHARQIKRTSENREKCKRESSNSKRKLQNLKIVYDIVNAGPRNRFTICSDSGFLIVHNCLFGGSIAALTGMAANYGMRRKELHDLHPHLWAAAGEETREKAVKRYEQRLKSRDKQKTDILSREAWIACKIIVDGWRRHNPASVEAWAALETGMRDAMRDPGVAKLTLGRIKYLAKSGFLWCMTPSGRCIAYASPKLKDQVWAKLRLEDGSWSEAEVVEREEAMRLEVTGRAQIQGATTPKVTALGVDSTTQKMTRYALYGGLAMENLAMGCERDILVNGMRRCETAGYAITLHNYDEAVAEVPRSFGSVEEMERLMLDLPSWTAGLPLAAHGWRGKRYAKR